MIDRLVRSLRELSTMPPDELAAGAHARERADCADAVRLELDCPQQALTSTERAALVRLSEEVEASIVDGASLAVAIRTARDALGLR